ncbi:MAG TPA: tRNA (adenosine(37)-N6)-dimethylallyltransferase MiaA [Thermoleophilia bacterium]|nr:tRNA (adenosine(37)-N6)-dimethylallyltransferase MiaA [Thermoleophilia bacterium]
MTTLRRDRGGEGRPPVVALFGVTALGKSDIALALAERLGADIVVADSMQVYRGLPILTNQPDAARLRRRRHHLVGVADPYAEFSVAAYAALAHSAIDGALAAGRRVVIEGGSGLYLRAALGGLEFRPAAAGERRDALRRDLEERWARDPDGVVEELRRRDPVALARLDTANPRRVLRALAAALETAPQAAGTTPEEAQHDALWAPGGRYEHRLVALAPDRAALRERVAARVAAMLAAGALGEVEALLAGGTPARTVRQAIGVRVLSAVLAGELTLDAAAAARVRRTNALVRRQLTWMRKLPASTTVAAGGRAPGAVAEEILRLLG